MGAGCTTGPSMGLLAPSRYEQFASWALLLWPSVAIEVLLKQQQCPHSDLPRFTRGDRPVGLIDGIDLSVIVVVDGLRVPSQEGP